MENLPHEILVLIFDRLPIKQVFVAMRVSKSIESACRENVAHRKHLGVNCGKEWHKQYIPAIDHIDGKRSRKKLLPMEESLLPMKTLTTLVVDNKKLSYLLVKQLVKNNAGTLQVLILPFYLDCMMLTVNMPHLRVLRGRRYFGDSVSPPFDFRVCPNLQLLLYYWCLSHDLVRLSVSLRSMIFRFDRDEHRYATTADGFKRLVNLSEIGGIIEFGDLGMVVRLLRLAKQLEHLELYSGIRQPISLSPVIDGLPFLKRLSLWDVRLEHDALDHISGLRHLQVLGIHKCGFKWTTKEVRRFLTNRPIATLTSLHLAVRDVGQVGELVAQVGRERGSILQFARFQY